MVRQPIPPKDRDEQWTYENDETRLPENPEDRLAGEYITRRPTLPATQRGRPSRSDAAALRRTAAVVRHRRHILDHLNLDTQVVQGTDSRLATRARTLMRTSRFLMP